MLNICVIVAAILKMAIGRNFSMSAINSRHHYLPKYQIFMISDNVEFLRYCGGHFEKKENNNNNKKKKKRSKNNKSPKLCLGDLINFRVVQWIKEIRLCYNSDFLEQGGYSYTVLFKHTFISSVNHFFLSKIKFAII
jgi:hypothetical protein